MGSFGECLRGAATDPTRLDQGIGRAAALLGLVVPSERAGRDGTDDILLAIAPAVRVSCLRLSADGILLALALAELVVRRLAALTSAPPTPQGAFGIISSVLPALHLLGCADVPVETPQRGRPKAPPFGDPAMVFAGYRVLRGVTGGDGVLNALEAGMARLSSVADRSAFLVEMGTMIGPSLKRRRTEVATDPAGASG
ncbi:MAG: hypothetical protein Q8N53_00890 [Longimicrobiales bacterium]|nr:hypothetical protein [Longimicrobiales bacterium]